MKTLFLSLMLLSATLSCAASNKTLTLRIVETSDVHGSFFPYDMIDRKPKAGSVARVSTYVNMLRKQHGKNLLLLDNGDILPGSTSELFLQFHRHGRSQHSLPGGQLP